MLMQFISGGVFVFNLLAILAGATGALVWVSMFSSLVAGVIGVFIKE